MKAHSGEVVGCVQKAGIQQGGAVRRETEALGDAPVAQCTRWPCYSGSLVSFSKAEHPVVCFVRAVFFVSVALMRIKSQTKGLPTLGSLFPSPSLPPSVPLFSLLLPHPPSFPSFFSSRVCMALSHLCHCNLHVRHQRKRGLRITAPPQFTCCSVERAWFLVGTRSLGSCEQEDTGIDLSLRKSKCLNPI